MGQAQLENLQARDVGLIHQNQKNSIKGGETAFFIWLIFIFPVNVVVFQKTLNFSQCFNTTIPKH